MGMSSFYKGFESDEAQAEAMRVFDKAVEHEHLMLDTADIYGPFTNEELISSCLIYQFRCTTLRFVFQRKRQRTKKGNSKSRRSAALFCHRKEAVITRLPNTSRRAAKASRQLRLQFDDCS